MKRTPCVEDFDAIRTRVGEIRRERLGNIAHEPLPMPPGAEPFTHPPSARSCEFCGGDHGALDPCVADHF